MGVRILVFLICIAAECMSFPVSGQTPTNKSIVLQTGSSASNAWLPFIAKYKTTRVKTPVSGSPITQETTEVLAVDSRGRRMTAVTTTSPPGEEPRTHIKVFDPVSHAKISWMSPGTEASVSAIPLGLAYGCSYAVGSIEGPTVKTTDADLGTATIQGVEARGRRYTKTITLGPHGKNPTLLNMVEMWTAIDPGLRGLLVRYAYVSDDRSSAYKTTKELVSFRQSEPDSSIFRVPSGLTIVNREVSPSTCPDTDELLPGPAPAN